MMKIAMVYSNSLNMYLDFLSRFYQYLDCNYPETSNYCMDFHPDLIYNEIEHTFHLFDNIHEHVPVLIEIPQTKILIMIL